MAYLEIFDYINQFATLSPAAQTVRAQSATENVPDLFWDAFFPRDTADSVVISQIIDTDFNPVADRRAWDTHGRLITPKVGDAEEWEMTPIEAGFKLGEREQQKLLERHNQAEQLALETFAADLPGRVDQIVEACLNRIEMDTFEAWLEGQITVRNPGAEDQTRVVDLGFPTAAYVDYSGDTWTSSDAFSKFMDEVWNARQRFGGVAGVIMPDYVLDLILQDAEGILQTNGRLTAGVADVEEAAQRRVGQTSFRILTGPAGSTFDTYESGGTDTTQTDLWAEGHIAFLPPGGEVGTTYFAPNIRARQVADENIGPEEINRNGVVVYYDSENKGKTFSAQAQVNALPIPNENRVYVVDTDTTKP